MQGYVDPLNRRCYEWEKQDAELLSWYKFLSSIRKNYSAFSSGDFEEIFVCDGVYVFKRYDDNCEVLVAVNVGLKDVELNFEKELYDLVTEKTYINKFELLKDKTAVLIKKND